MNHHFLLQTVLLFLCLCVNSSFAETMPAHKTQTAEQQIRAALERSSIASSEFQVTELPEEQLAEKAAAQGLKGKHYPDVNTALKDALAHAGKNDLLLVCGSVFVVGEVNVEALAAYSV